MAKKEKEIVEGQTESTSGIIVNDPETFRPRVLPLIVNFPEGYNPSKAQIERAKVLNGYAYSFPQKWAVEKDKHIADLEALKDAPDPVEDPNVSLTVGTVPKVS